MLGLIIKLMFSTSNNNITSEDYINVSCENCFHISIKDTSAGKACINEYDNTIHNTYFMFMVALSNTYDTKYFSRELSLNYVGVILTLQIKMYNPYY